MKPVILYEDNHLLVVDKPHNLLTQPSGSDQINLEDICKNYVKEKYQKPGNIYLHAVHRLDKPVAGIVLFAKTSKALSRLNESIRMKEVEKKYEALIEGRLPGDAGELIDYIVHDSHKAAIVPKNTPKAKEAKLQYSLIEEKNGISHIAIQLETGRYHQIRAQLAHAGCPIIGDTKYGGRESVQPGIALIHKSLSITHPTTKELLRIRSVNVHYYIKHFFN